MQEKNTQYIPMVLAFDITPQGDAENAQSLSITACNLYIYDLIRLFGKKVQNIKTELVPTLVGREARNLKTAGKDKITGKTIEATRPSTVYSNSYQYLIKLEADISVFQDIHTWYLNTLNTDEASWCYEAATCGLQSLPEYMQEE